MPIVEDSSVKTAKIDKYSKTETTSEQGAEAKELAKMMMSKRDKKLYDKIQFGKKRKQATADNLRNKKKLLVGK